MLFQILACFRSMLKSVIHRFPFDRLQSHIHRSLVLTCKENSCSNIGILFVLLMCKAMHWGTFLENSIIKANGIFFKSTNFLDATTGSGMLLDSFGILKFFKTLKLWQKAKNQLLEHSHHLKYDRILDFHSLLLQYFNQFFVYVKGFSANLLGFQDSNYFHFF